MFAFQKCFPSTKYSSIFRALFLVFSVGLAVSLWILLISDSMKQNMSSLQQGSRKMMNSTVPNPPKETKNKSRAPVFPDFDYNYPIPDKYAYVWYALNNAQICSSLIALNRLIDLRKGQPNEKRKAQLIGTQVDYMLLYPEEVLTTEEGIENIPMRRKWIENGGEVYALEGLKRDMEFSEAVLQAKIFATAIPGYVWIIMMEPDGLPLKSLDDMFFMLSEKYLKGSEIISSPRAGPLAGNFVNRNLLQSKECFGTRTDLISTSLLLFQSTKELQRLNHAKETLLGYPDTIDDVTCFNYEFSCNSETGVLNYTYGTPDYLVTGSDLLNKEEAEQIMNDKNIVPNLQDISYLYFASRLKAWQNEYLNRLSDGPFKELIYSYRREARQYCSLYDEIDWQTSEFELL